MIRAIPTSSDERTEHAEFTALVAELEPRLQRALAGAVGLDRAPDAAAEAIAWAWEHRRQVQGMANPAGYLYRVATSSVRIRFPKRVRYLVVEPATMPEIEPALPDAIRSLPVQQRTAVWLVYACQWTYAEVAEAMKISSSAVGTHASRGLKKLRSRLGEAHG